MLQESVPRDTLVEWVMSYPLSCRS